MSSDGSLREFYYGKNIFLTGGSGFLGICLLEKVLRTIPNHGEIYLLMRPKRGQEIQERLETIKTNSVFEELLKERKSEEVFKKVKVISGDVGQDGLGLSPEDRQHLTEKINIIFHSAATLDFGESLKDTVNVNLLGTRRITDLAKQCPHLQAVVYVSSAYANSFELDVQEKLYPLTTDVDELIKKAETLSREELEVIVPEILGNHPNTYTITKHMAEHEIQKIEDHVPCAIVRPSMIICALKEPAVGWTISKNGPLGFIMGASKGVIRRLPLAKELIYDYIPVDTVVNTLMAAGFHVGKEKPKTVEIFHCTSSTRKPFRWEMVEDDVNDFLQQYPLKSAVWYPYLAFVSSIWMFKISALFVHMIPGFFLDLMLRATGGRPMLMKLHRNVNSSLDRLRTFIFTEWKFHAKKTDELQKWLPEKDQEDYRVTIDHFNWKEIVLTMVIGAKVYLCKEPLRTLEASKKKNASLKTLHYGLQAIGYILAWNTASAVLNISLLSAASVLPLVYIVQSFI